MGVLRTADSASTHLLKSFASTLLPVRQRKVFHTTCCRRGLVEGITVSGEQPVLRHLGGPFKPCTLALRGTALRCFVLLARDDDLPKRHGIRYGIASREKLEVMAADTSCS